MDTIAKAARKEKREGPPSEGSPQQAELGKAAEEETATTPAVEQPPQAPTWFGQSDPEFLELLWELEEALGTPLVVFMHNGSVMIDSEQSVAFLRICRDVARGAKVTLLLDSPGGDAGEAYRVARALQRQGGFDVLVPRYAKSAATLLALGADRILMGEDAELGPLDVQVFEGDDERYISGLDAVQAIERIHAAALTSVDQAMNLFAFRSTKKTDQLLPVACRFVSDMMRPMMESLEAVHYTRMARLLKVAEEYAIRLLATRVGLNEATRIARRLVQHYPDHGFIIDPTEATDMGLPVTTLDHTHPTWDILCRLEPYLGNAAAIGRLPDKEPDNVTEELGSEQPFAQNGELPGSGDGHRSVQADGD